jgi:hypothetical protein
MYLTTFVVRGKGSFPTDMLRRDTCFPFDAEAVENMHHEHGQERSIELGVHHYHKHIHGISEGRWRSFGWEITDSTTQKVSR